MLAGCALRRWPTFADTQSPPDQHAGFRSDDDDVTPDYSTDVHLIDVFPSHDGSSASGQVEEQIAVGTKQNERRGATDSNHQTVTGDHGNLREAAGFGGAASDDLAVTSTFVHSTSPGSGFRVARIDCLHPPTLPKQGNWLVQNTENVQFVSCHDCASSRYSSVCPALHVSTQNTQPMTCSVSSIAALQAGTMTDYKLSDSLLQGSATKASKHGVIEQLPILTDGWLYKDRHFASGIWAPSDRTSSSCGRSASEYASTAVAATGPNMLAVPAESVTGFLWDNPSSAVMVQSKEAGLSSASVQHTTGKADTHVKSVMALRSRHDVRQANTRLKKYQIKVEQLRRATDSKQKMLGAVYVRRHLLLSDVVTMTQLVQECRQQLDSQRLANKALMRHIDHLTALEGGDPGTALTATARGTAESGFNNSSCSDRSGSNNDSYSDRTGSNKH